MDPGRRCEFWTGMCSEEQTWRVRQSVELRGPHPLHGAGRPAAGPRLSACSSWPRGAQCGSRGGDVGSVVTVSSGPTRSH